MSTASRCWSYLQIESDSIGARRGRGECMPHYRRAGCACHSRKTMRLQLFSRSKVQTTGLEDTLTPLEIAALLHSPNITICRLP